MKTNVKPIPQPIFTHEGAPAARITIEQALRRSVLSCLLWEKEFYEDGQSIVERIDQLASQVSPQVLADLAVEARSVMHLRHVPLRLLLTLLRTGKKSDLPSRTIAEVIQRPDEMAELLAMYWARRLPDGKKPPMAAQLKKGLALAFPKFSAYSLAKYNRPGLVTLRDVLFLARPLSKDPAKVAAWQGLANGILASPDTWEVALSAGADKKATWERLIAEGKLGYLALLRNLRNMVDVGVDFKIIWTAITDRQGGAEKVLPFRYVAAMRAAPMFAQALDQSLTVTLATAPTLRGKTIVLIDVSGSMEYKLSAKSDLSRMDAAAALGSLILSDQLRVFTFSNELIEVPAFRGLASIDPIIRSQSHQGTKLFDAVQSINKLCPYDRIIVITDEQAEGARSSYSPYAFGGQEHSTIRRCPAPKGLGYMINVASAKNGVGYGPWFHLDGFSEGIIRYISEAERQAIL